MHCRLTNKSATSHKEDMMTEARRQEEGVTKVKPALPAEVLGLLQTMLPPARDAHLHSRAAVLCLQFSGAMPHLLSSASHMEDIWQHIR